MPNIPGLIKLGLDLVRVGGDVVKCVHNGATDEEKAKLRTDVKQLISDLGALSSLL